MGGLGPMLGQHGHFALYAEEKIPALEDDGKFSSNVRTVNVGPQNDAVAHLDGNIPLDVDWVLISRTS
jgi:hypothetical protein